MTICALDVISRILALLNIKLYPFKQAKRGRFKPIITHLALLPSHRNYSFNMNLLDLPIEILTLLPHHLRNITDFKDAATSCRTLHIAFAATSPRTILHLAAASSREYEVFHPHPHFLVAATVRQVADWARLSASNTIVLRETFEDGIDALYDLCLAKAGLTLADIRRLHEFRYSTINPVVDMIDRCAGAQWYATPDFWDGGVSDANTIYCEPQRTLFQVAIYGELFSSAMSEVLEPVGLRASPPRFDLATRFDYWKYCVPDWLCIQDCEAGPVKHKGPYARGTQSFEPFFNERGEEERQPHDDQGAMIHVLQCRTWTEAWERVRRDIGPDFEEKWRQELWMSIVQIQGLGGLEMLRPGGVEKWRLRLEEMRRKIEGLDRQLRPWVHTYGMHGCPAGDAPGMADEVGICKGWYSSREDSRYVHT